MRRDILTISDALVEPPSEPMVFRTITMLCRYEWNMDILLHTTQDMKDLYYHWMKPRGMLDYVAYILNEMEYEDGVRIDTIGIYPQTIVTKSLRLENQLYILSQVKTLAGID
jgi:hypothetical protein